MNRKTKNNDLITFDRFELSLIKSMAIGIESAIQDFKPGKSNGFDMPEDDIINFQLDLWGIYRKLSNKTEAIANISDDLSSEKYSLLHKVILNNQKYLLDSFIGSLKWWEKLLFRSRGKKKLESFNRKFNIGA